MRWTALIGRLGRSEGEVDGPDWTALEVGQRVRWMALIGRLGRSEGEVDGTDWTAR